MTIYFVLFKDFGIRNAQITTAIPAARNGITLAGITASMLRPIQMMVAAISAMRSRMLPLVKSLLE